MLRIALFLALVAVSTALPTIPAADPRIDVNGDWRIVGGSTAPTGAYPFIVSIRSPGNSHFCGGSIINNRWILTAAHCLVGRSTSNTFVVAGTNTLNYGGVSHGSNMLLIHAGYNQNSMTNDIGVIGLATPLTYTNVISPVPLNTANTGSVSAVLIGWGVTSTGGSIPNNLQHISTVTVTTPQCQQGWGGSVTGMQICAFTRAGQGACNGDSGGPLVQAGNSAQLGIVSYGRPCAQGVPDVYTRVSSYITWINSAIAS